MTNFKTILTQLYDNLNLLRQREAKYGGNPPLDLFNQIADHEQAIALTEQATAYDEAERLYQSGLTICREGRDLQGIGVFLLGLGRMALIKRQRDEAAAMFREAQERFLAIGLLWQILQP